MDDVESSIFGYESIEHSLPEELAYTEGWTTAQWQEEFDKTRNDLKNFFAARDGLAILARTAARHMMETAKRPKKANISYRPLEQVEVEIAQTFILLGERNIKPVPTSPKNFERYWSLMNRHIHGFLKKIPLNPNATDIVNTVTHRARLQTLYYRNLFTRDNCEKTILSLLKRIDTQSNEALGYEISELYCAAIKIVELIEDRFSVFGSNINILMRSNSRKKVLEAINFFSSVSNISRLVELVDISRSHNCNKHSSLLVVVSVQFCSFRTRKSIGKHLSALFLLFCVRSWGK